MQRQFNERIVPSFLLLDYESSHDQISYLLSERFPLELITLQSKYSWAHNSF